MMKKIDKYFKLENPKITKRNWKVNPWITDGLVISIKKKVAPYNMGLQILNHL